MAPILIAGFVIWGFFLIGMQEEIGNPSNPNAVEERQRRIDNTRIKR